MDTQRSYEKIEENDLERLAALARQDREDFFSRYARWKSLFADKVVCVALCQGAALHYVDGKNGVKDFDVWTFFARNSEASFPARRIVSKDFGSSKFNKDPAETRYMGRRVDLVGRSINCSGDASPIEAIQEYLRLVKTLSAKQLALKTVILIDPPQLRGAVAWNRGKP
jgi:hypothetical protein